METKTKTDAIGFSPLKRPKSKTITEGPSSFSSKYSMNHSKRGVAVIFNNENFDIPHCRKREGTIKDRDDLVRLFESLKFHVYVHNDFTKPQIQDFLVNLAHSDHSDEDCLVVVVLSHGDNGKIYAKNTHYPPDMLWEHFNGKSSPSLVGKPKLFFIQACRGDARDAGVQISSSTEIDSIKERKNVYSLPVMSDFLVMYSTVEDYCSWRNPSLGSYFIQSLIRQITEHVSDKDLLSILTCVNREVAIGFSEEMMKARAAKYGHKQMPCIVSMLTRDVYFN